MFRVWQNYILMLQRIRRIGAVMVKFSFWAYGILAVAALALVLYFVASQSGLQEVSQNLWFLVVLIIVSWIVYMFVKLLKRG